MVLSRDTSPEAERVQMELLRRMSPARKLALMAGLLATGRELVLAGIRHRNPEASHEELEDRFAMLMLGPDLGGSFVSARRARRKRIEASRDGH